MHGWGPRVINYELHEGRDYLLPFFVSLELSMVPGTKHTQCLLTELEHHSESKGKVCGYMLDATNYK